MVRFLEDPEQYKSCAMIERIDSSIERYPFYELVLYQAEVNYSWTSLYCIL